MGHILRGTGHRVEALELRRLMAVVTAADVSVSESAGSAVFRVTLDAPVEAAVVVGYVASPLTAKAGKDFRPRGGVVRFGPGQTSADVTIPVTNDDVAESDETFRLSLRARGTGVEVATPSATATIIDDDAVPTVSVSDARVREFRAGTRRATLAVTLSAASGRPVTVRYATSDGTSTADDAYKAATGTLTFAPGQTRKAVSVTLLPTKVSGAFESFYVNLTLAAGATVADPFGVVAILAKTTPGDIDIEPVLIRTLDPSSSGGTLGSWLGDPNLHSTVAGGSLTLLGGRYPTLSISPEILASRETSFTIAPVTPAVFAPGTTVGGTLTYPVTGVGGGQLSSSFYPGAGHGTENIGTTVGGTLTVLRAGTSILHYPGGLYPGAGETVTIAPDAPSTTYGYVSLLSGGTVDVTTHPLLVRRNAEAIRGVLDGAYANGTWNGSGITSSVAAGDPEHRTALGYAPTLFGDGSVRIACTLYGDANLDGTVDDADRAIVEGGLASGGAGWHNGDFNYDQVIDVDDLVLLDRNFGRSAPTAAAEVTIDWLGAPVTFYARALPYTPPSTGAGSSFRSTGSGGMVLTGAISYGSISTAFPGQMDVSSPIDAEGDLLIDPASVASGGSLTLNLLAQSELQFSSVYVATLVSGSTTV